MKLLWLVLFILTEASLLIDILFIFGVFGPLGPIGWNLAFIGAILSFVGLVRLIDIKTSGGSEA